LYASITGSRAGSSTVSEAFEVGTGAIVPQRSRVGY
jgi:UDP-N-acetylglucosamine:LPS N-acetylglucosamine transferase